MTTKKLFDVLVRQTVTRTHTVTVEAESSEDAKVLAKYERIPSFYWVDESEHVDSVAASTTPAKIEIVMDDAHIPGMADTCGQVEALTDFEPL
jgi:hypothetical protein